MSVPRRGLAAGLVASLAVTTALGCATAKFSAETLPDGTKHLRCKLALPDCLVEAERVCQGRHYAVVRAVDEHDRRGGPELYTDARTSEAIVRCGPVVGWPAGYDPMAPPVAAPPAAAPPVAAPAAPPAPAEPPPPPPVRACFPGSTQACVGPGGCAGGQACLPDATAFGPCDCGGGASGVGRTR
jgi:hypothetical protein